MCGPVLVLFVFRFLHAVLTVDSQALAKTVGEEMCRSLQVQNLPGSARHVGLPDGDSHALANIVGEEMFRSLHVQNLPLVSGLSVSHVGALVFLLIVRLPL